MIIGAEAVLCNSFVSYLLYGRRESSLQSCPGFCACATKSSNFVRTLFVRFLPQRFAPPTVRVALREREHDRDRRNDEPDRRDEQPKFHRAPDILARDRDGRDDQDDVVVHPTVAHRASK